MKIKLGWYLGAVLIPGLAALSVSCSAIEPPNAPIPVATTVPPFIPHRLEGRGDCRLCHATGIGGAPQFPANHSLRPSDVCQACHQPKPGLYADNEPVPMPVPVFPAETKPPAGTTPAPVSAKDLFSAKCAACHGVNRQGTPGLAPALTPESLATRTDTEIKNTILDGRPGTAMIPWKGTLSPEEIDALFQLIKHTPP
ncbi:MAG: cytochrome c [Chloroflexi bacterium]|nr:cytochrome c [Chloroflexota bacterium]